MARLNQAMQDLLRYNAAILPKKRSTFDKSHSHTTTFDSSYLVPLMYDRVLPGDEKQIRVSALARMATPIAPTMDTAYMDIWAFYVPDRLWWSHAKEFYGENLDASFNPDGEYVMPYLKPSEYMVDPRELAAVDKRDGIGSLADYFGYPIGYFTSPEQIALWDSKPDFWSTAGLFRSYQLIWNDWFRNSSVQPALRLNTGDTVTAEELPIIKQIRKVNKFPDLFTTLLREPQAGASVLLPLGDTAPVVGSDTVNYDVAFPFIGRVEDSSFPPDTRNFEMRAEGVDGSLGIYDIFARNYQVPSDNLGFPMNLYLPNLTADLRSATSATINNLRAAITVQQLLEIDGMAGKRYQQILQAHFGVFTPDATLQRPELLGASRTTIGMRQVLQTSATEDEGSPLGTTAAFSLTNMENEWICNKAFTEPGFIIVLGAVRPVQSYSQGLNPLLTKINRYDHYWPVFENLGNQPMPKSAIYFTANQALLDYADTAANINTVFDALDDTFGYSEAWIEYRMMNNRVSGAFRPDLVGSAGQVGSLSVWNYAQAFALPPVLNSEFVEEDETLIERTLAVKNEPQFLLDVYFDYKDTKNMGVRSVPGLTRL